MREARAFRLRQLGADGIRLVLRLRQPGRGEVLVRTPGSGLRRGKPRLARVGYEGTGRGTVWPSPWRLGRTDRALAGEWFTGWLAAACAHRPELAAQTRHYAQQRVADAAVGRLRATVHHRDLLVWPR